jgi:sulfur-oxidizing protein SoxY
MGTSGIAWLLALAVASGAALAQTPAVDPESTQRTARWQQLRHAFFGDRLVRDGQAVLTLDAPPRALDPAQVPIGLSWTGPARLKGLYLVIDNNPSPLAARFTFGLTADPRLLKLQVRVNEYTSVHAIAETQAGDLYMVEKFVKATGGCSAPVAATDTEALKETGRMTVKWFQGTPMSTSMLAQLTVRHPNFSGMQMDQLTRHFTPAHYIRSVEASHAGGAVFSMVSDISLSTDPVITFACEPGTNSTLKVVVQDTRNATFTQDFAIPAK